MTTGYTLLFLALKTAYPEIILNILTRLDKLPEDILILVLTIDY